MGKLITIPFAALLRLMYTISGSYGLSILLFSLIVTLIMVPFQMKSKRSMVRMGKLTDKQAELQKQYAKNQQKYQEELAKLYQEEGVNPMGGCLWSLLPMFVLIPLYSIIRQPIVYFMGISNDAYNALLNAATTIGYDADSVYNRMGSAYGQIYLSDFITQNWDKYDWKSIEGVGDKLLQMRFEFLGVNLGIQPSDGISNFVWEWGTIGLILIPILAAVFSYIQTIVINKSNGQSQQQQQANMKMLNLMMPLMSLWFCFSMPAAMGLYWIANSIWGMIRESTLGKYYTKKINEEEEEREAKRAAARKLRMEEAKKRAAEQPPQEPRKKKQPQKSPEKISTTDAGRVAERPYARGRSYKADRYDEKE